MTRSQPDHALRPAQPTIGLLEWFRPGEHARVERALDGLDALGVAHLRTGVSWADFLTPDGRAWYDWLLPALAARVDVLPCFSYTPPSLGEMAGTNAPPRRLEDYADFLCYCIELYGEHFEWVELWNEPDNHREWNAAFDPDYAKFAAMAGNAAAWARKEGKRTLLGGLANADPNFVSLLHDHGALQHFDAVGVHGFPFSFEFYWEGWAKRVGRLRERLDWCERPDCQLWITESGYSTWRHDERKQLVTFLDAIDAPAERVYWYSLDDLDPELPTVDGFHSDEREYHFGLNCADGREKLLARLWREHGIRGVRQQASLLRKQPKPTGRYALVTGGCGFVGTNLCDRLAGEGRQVIAFDSLTRPGVERNVEFLKSAHGGRVHVECADVLDAHAVHDAVRHASAIWHFAAQVAVTTSLDRPVHDFEVNARGTLNVLEAARRRGERGGGGGDAAPPLIFTSTNKVFGDLGDVELDLIDGRWQPADAALRQCGVADGRCLDFQSPYGVSKGAADQYVLDYARSYGLPATVFRMSCIYGPHQCGNEDQGWLAHFARAALRGEGVTLYGDGRQVRDALFVGDLVDLLCRAELRVNILRGEAFNVGGGASNAVSLRDVLRLIEQCVGRPVPTRFGDWRTGDQKWYVTDARRIGDRLGWHAATPVARGVAALVDWLRDNLGDHLDDAPAASRPGAAAYSKAP